MILYRCADCGKWSHAKRRPTHHRRFIANTDTWPGRALTAGLPVIEEVEPYHNGDPDSDGNPGGVWVKCGPFETWVAIKELG